MDDDRDHEGLESEERAGARSGFFLPEEELESDPSYDTDDDTYEEGDEDEPESL
jgi:hypothetical protein